MNEPEHGMQSSSNLTPDDLTHPADVPAADRNRIAAQRALNGVRRVPGMPCFGYSADTPGAPRRMPVGPLFQLFARYAGRPAADAGRSLFQLFGRCAGRPAADAGRLLFQLFGRCARAWPAQDADESLFPLLTGWPRLGS